MQDIKNEGKELIGKIHSLESFGTVDGPGVRFVVFFQGCPLRCLYCHNPDTWELSSAPHLMSADEILQKMTRNLPFYKSGGITATGGEPLMQLEFLIELFKKAHALGIHTCLDTSGATFDRGNTARMKLFSELLSYTDLVMLDIKHTSEESYKSLCRGSLCNTLDFLDFLEENNTPTYIRHVIVPNITYDDESLKELGRLISPYTVIEKLDILPYHVLGRHKYESLGIEYPLGDTEPLTPAEAARAMKIVEDERKNNRP